MTGKGSRFKAAGYEHLKPFIEVEGRPMIDYVVSMFPKDSAKFIFVCRRSSMTTDELNTLDNIVKSCSSASVVFINEENWEKEGPVKDSLKASSVIDDDMPTIINYCDFFCLWDCESFLKEAEARDADGAVPCYTGFHPHLIPKKNLYASCNIDNDGNLIEIREKFSFEKDKTKVHHSPGIYYFKTGKMMKEYCQKLVDSGNKLKGEYYASLVYNEMVKDNKKVWVPDNVPYFCQWGTPEDLEEFKMWIAIVKGL